MVTFKFTREFWHWARSRKCLLCKAMALFVYPSGERQVSEEVAAAAEAAGAGQRLLKAGGDDTQ